MFPRSQHSTSVPGPRGLTHAYRHLDAAAVSLQTESDVLYVVMLNATDSFDCHSGIKLALRLPEKVNPEFRLKKVAGALG